MEPLLYWVICLVGVFSRQSVMLMQPFLISHVGEEVFFCFFCTTDPWAALFCLKHHSHYGQLTRLKSRLWKKNKSGYDGRYGDITEVNYCVYVPRTLLWKVFITLFVWFLYFTAKMLMDRKINTDDSSWHLFVFSVYHNLYVPWNVFNVKHILWIAVVVDKL